MYYVILFERLLIRTHYYKLYTHRMVFTLDLSPFRYNFIFNSNGARTNKKTVSYPNSSAHMNKFGFVTEQRQKNQVLNSLHSLLIHPAYTSYIEHRTSVSELNLSSFFVPSFALALFRLILFSVNSC